MKKKTIIGIVAVIAVVLVGMKGKSLLEKRKSEVANEALPAVAKVSVKVVKPRRGVLKHKEAYLAQLKADKSIALSTKLAGYVEKVLVEESQFVKKGDVLVRIDAVELTSTIASLKVTLMAQKSDLALAESIYARNEKLFKVGGISKEKLEISKVSLNAKHSMLESTKEKIAQLEHQLSYLKIVAPFDGRIDKIMMYEGDLAAVGKPILTMSNTKQKLIFSYAPTQNNLIKQGQKVFLGQKQVGRVKSIYTVSNNGLVSAEVALETQIDLPTGANIRIEVLTQELEGCLLNANTILHKKEGTFVMVYQKEHFVPLAVNVQMQEANQVILSPCPERPVAQASEVKLATLPAYENIEILGGSDD